MVDRLRQELEKREVELRMKGIFTVTQFVVYIVEDWLRSHPPRLEVFNHQDDMVRIKDNERSLIVEVRFKMPDVVACSHDEGECIHVVFALSRPDVVKTLRERGWKGPSYV